MSLLIRLLCLPLLGLSAARAASVIANWDLVPLQRVDQAFEVGVVAFHTTGAKVLFFVDGKPVADVAEPRLNPRTRVVEYFFTLDPKDYTDGPVTLTATAHPRVAEGHQPRELPAQVLYINGAGSLTVNSTVWVDAEGGSDATGSGSEAAPFASLKRAFEAVIPGGTLYLKKGRGYKLSGLPRNGEKVWTTVSAAPGLKADDVHILTYGPDDSTSGRYGRSMVRWKNVSLYCERPGRNFGSIFYLENDMHVWIDGSVMYDANGRFAGSVPFNGRGAKVFLTDGTLIRDLSNGSSAFQRNIRFERICSDIYRAGDNLTAINVVIDTIDRGETAAHPDFFQIHSPGNISENIILYNVRAYRMGAQGLFGGPDGIRNAAFVNLLLEKRPEKSYLMSQLTGTWENVLLWHFTFDASSFLFRDTENLRELDIRNGIFASASIDKPDAPGIAITHCHFSGGRTVLGAEATSGDPGFLNRDDSNYRLTPDSPAFRSGKPAPGVPADIDGYPYDPERPNRGAFSSRNPAAP